MKKDNQENHSNNPVVVLLLIALLSIGGYFLFNKNQKGEQIVLKDIISKDNNIYYFPKDYFSAYFPQEPTFRTINGNREYYLNDVNGTLKFLAIHTINSPYKPDSTIKENLDNIGVFTGDTNFTLISSKTSVYKDLPMIEYVANNKSTEYYIAGRNILKGNELYTFEYYYKSGEEDKTLENIFLNSILFNDEPATFNSQQQKEIDVLKKKVEDLKNTKPKIIIKEVPAPTPPPTLKSLSLADIIKQWRPRTVYIECTWSYADTGEVYSQASGSGLAMQYSNGQISFITNKHVLSDTGGYGPSTCLSKLPDDDTIYTTTFKDNLVNIEGSDWGLINIMNPDSYLKELVNTDFNYCTSEAAIGDSVVILGYPSYGSSFYDITATEGIISGYDGQYYTTSAKIEHGNSGGLAIDEKNNCYLGIPTAVVTGGFESLGRILDVRNIFK